MPAGILIMDENQNVIFDGSQRIPKILASASMLGSDKSKVVQLPRAIKGELFFFFKSDFYEGEPYYNPQTFSFNVTTSGTTATVTYTGVTGGGTQPSNGAFTVFIGEY